MKRFLTHIFLFALLLFLVDKLFCVLLYNTAHTQDDQRLLNILDGQMQKDIIILGSSRGAHDFIAKTIEEKTGQSTYNLSYRGSDVTFHHFILQTLLNFNKAPKTVVLTIDQTYQFVDTKTLNFRYDKLFAVKKNNYINSILIEENKHSYFSKFLCLGRLNKNDFSYTKQPVKPINKLSSHGSKIFVTSYDTTMVFNSKLTNYKTEAENYNKVEAFKAIQQLCKANAINLVYAFPPSFETFDQQFYTRFLDLVEQPESIFVYDTLNQDFKQNKYFIDKSHLNQNGATIFTNSFCEFLIKVN